ncbi:RluA family pseudouridine synthase [Pradoshia sp.]
MAKPFTLHFNATKEEEGILLREFLARKRISKAALTDIKFRGGKLMVNERIENVRYIIQPDDKITVQYPPEASSEKLKGDHIPLSIVYEDDYVLVIEKPAGMSTIPSREHPAKSLANAIVHYYEQTGHLAAVHIVTRLDRDTSGLVLIAKHRHIHHLFSLSQKEKSVSREYVALVEGHVQPPEGEVDRPIGRMAESIIKREVRSDGQSALTLYKTIRQFPTYSLMALKLMTGRTHQIRVHMSDLGHPLLGDDLYGGSRDLIARQALHCGFLTFNHPITGESLQFKSTVPSDMQRLIN